MNCIIIIDGFPTDDPGETQRAHVHVTHATSCEDARNAFDVLFGDEMMGEDSPLVVAHVIEDSPANRNACNIGRCTGITIDARTGRVTDTREDAMMDVILAIITGDDPIGYTSSDPTLN